MGLTELVGTTEEPIDFNEITETGIFLIKGYVKNFVAYPDFYVSEQLTTISKTNISTPIIMINSLSDNGRINQLYYNENNGKFGIFFRVGNKSSIADTKWRALDFTIENATTNDFIRTTSLINKATLMDIIKGLTGLSSQNYLPQLNTEDKTSLISAINEVLEKTSNNGGGSSYELPVATTETLGGIKVGDGLSILDGVLSVESGNLNVENIQILEGTEEKPINLSTLVEQGLYILKGYVTDDYDNTFRSFKIGLDNNNFIFGIVGKSSRENTTKIMATIQYLFIGYNIFNRYTSGTKFSQNFDKFALHYSSNFTNSDEQTASNVTIKNAFNSYIISDINSNRNKYTLNALTTTNKEALVGAINEINEKSKSMNDIINTIYPIGSYYETSNISFDPNSAWGGTWEEDSNGRVTIAIDSEDTDFNTIGKIGGSKIDNLNNAYAKLNFWGGQGGGIAIQEKNLSSDDTFTANYGKGLGASDAQGYGNLMTALGGKVDTLQPYIVVKRWHRVA